MYFSAIPSVELASAEGTTGGYSGKKQDCAALRFGLAPADDLNKIRLRLRLAVKR